MDKLLYYLSLTATRSTEDENPCSASSDFPAIFVASIPCANASSHGAVPFGTVAVGAVNKKKNNNYCNEYVSIRWILDLPTHPSLNLTFSPR